jgi:hypothetical protein
MNGEQVRIWNEGVVSCFKVSLRLKNFSRICSKMDEIQTVYFENASLQHYCCTNLHEHSSFVIITTTTIIIIFIIIILLFCSEGYENIKEPTQMHTDVNINQNITIHRPPLWSIVVRVLGYRYRGLGSIPRATRFSEK